MATDDGPNHSRIAVVVLGMHRSGTSALARLIGDLGATLPSDPNPPSADNPAGYWEPARIVATNDRMLRALDSAWLDPRPLDTEPLAPALRSRFTRDLREAIALSFGRAPCFVLKDPRICRMVPFYRDLLAGMGIGMRVVLALRHPAEVAASLAQRDQLTHGFSAFLWARHLIDAERDTRDLPRIAVSFEDLVADWSGCGRRLAAFLAPLLPPADLDRIQPTIRGDLRHHRSDDCGSFGVRLGGLVRALHDALADGRPDVIDRLADDVDRAAATAADVLAAEFHLQRLTSTADALASGDPAGERAKVIEALGRLYHPRASAHPTPGPAA